MAQAESVKLPVKCIVFDLGGVLVRVDYMKLCRAISRLTGEKAEAIHERAVASGLGKDFDQGLIAPAEFARRIREDLSVPLDDDGLRRLWNDVLERDREMEALLSGLAAAYPLVMLSNVNPWHFEYLQETCPFFALFEDFVLSCREGVLKPHPLLYKKAARAAGFEPSECLYIDDVREYVDGAAAQGMRAVLFRGRSSLEESLRSLGLSW